MKLIFAVIAYLVFVMPSFGQAPDCNHQGLSYSQGAVICSTSLGSKEIRAAVCNANGIWELKPDTLCLQGCVYAGTNYSEGAQVRIAGTNTNPRVITCTEGQWTK